MGSRITRALSVTDRQRRVNPANQEQVKQLIRIMCSSMYGCLVFGVGFLTQHSNQAHQHCLSYLSIALVGSFVMNALNQQFCMIFGWLMITLQILCFGQKVRLMFTIGAFLVISAVLTNLYNYFKQPNTQNPFLNNLNSSTFVLISNCLLTISHCSSHFIKILRSQANGTRIQVQHNLGMKCMFTFLGFMIIAITFLGHIYIRNLRFLPLTFLAQIKSFFALKIVRIIQIIIILVSIRSLFLSAQGIQKCSSGIFLIVILILNLTLLKLLVILLQKIITKNISSFIIKVTSLVFLYSYIVLNVFEQTFYLSYSIFLILNTFIITQIINKIEKQLRVNYILGFMIAFLLQSNNLQHAHIQMKQVDVISHLIIAGICLPIGFFIEDVVNFVVQKRKYNQVQGGISIQQFDPRN